MDDGAPFGMRLREIPVFPVSRNVSILPFLERGMHIQIREDGFTIARTRAAIESRSGKAASRASPRLSFRGHSVIEGRDFSLEMSP